MSRMIAAALVIALSIDTPARAGFSNGVELSEMCKQKSQVCLGYVMGVFDDLLLEENTGPESRICVPSAVSGGQIIEAVNRHLAASPRQLHWQANVFVRDATISSLGCKW